MHLSLSTFQDWYKQHAQEIQKDFFTLLSMPSISTDSKYDKETYQTAQWLVAHLKKMGLEAELWQTIGHPIVFASHLKAGKDAPTLLLYHHYDVQPVDPLELWHSDPFEPVIKNNQVFARGALDNKGQLFYSMTALRAFLELSKEIPCNIKVFIEGEEESGGKGTVLLLPEKKEALKADYLLVIDMDLPAAGVPGITLGMRGILAMDIAVKNASIDLHSGTHGGIALNPNRVLVTLLSKLWDASGKVTIPGFYEDVESLAPAELAMIDMSFDELDYQKKFGVHAFANEKGCSLLESNWLRPTLELNGVGGGYTGLGFKTVIPALAKAKLSCRLVPGQNPDKIGKQILDFLRQNTPQGIELQLEIHHGAAAFRSKFDSSIVKIAANAYEEVMGQRCRFLLCGASVPIVTDLAKISGAEVALIGFGLPEDNIHAPNEHFGLDRFEQGFLTISRILTQIR